MENKVIKNMEYWKKKNNIPGIEALADSGLTDGRAGSSAFQMAVPVTPNAFGEDENTEVGKELLKEEAKEAMKKSPLEAEVPQGRVDDQGRPTSTMEDRPKEMKTMPTESMYVEGDILRFDHPNGDQMEVKDPNGLYDPKGRAMDYNYKQHSDGYLIIDSIAKEREMEKGEVGVPGNTAEGQIVGGVGGPQMQSPTKIYEDGKRRKNYTY